MELHIDFFFLFFFFSFPASVRLIIPFSTETCFDLKKKVRADGSVVGGWMGGWGGERLGGGCLRSCIRR